MNTEKFSIGEEVLVNLPGGWRKGVVREILNFWGFSRETAYAVRDYGIDTVARPSSIKKLKQTK